MTSLFLLAIIFTLGISALCSLLEAFILSTSIAEIEALKKVYPKRGKMLESFKEDIERTITSILVLNTIANTLGAIVVGALAQMLFDNTGITLTTIGMVMGILVFSEIIPKNLGYYYRIFLRLYLIHPLYLIRVFMRPVTYFMQFVIRPLSPEDTEANDESKEEEIILLAEKHAKDGSLTTSERDMISNALSLDDVRVGEIMTPRTVISALEDNLNLAEVFKDYSNPNFARIPVFQETIDNIVGIVRRRDLMAAYAEDKDDLTVGSLANEPLFIPESATGAHALHQFLQKHQQIGVVVDEFGSTAGVITMEDIMEHILGREIYEDSDVAVDMRELARHQAEQMDSITETIDESAPKSNPTAQ